MVNNISDVCSAVKKIAWGYLLLFLDFNIMTINILPDWVGYIMIVSALGAVIVDEDSLRKLRPIGIILVIWNVIEWVLNIFGIGAYLGFISVFPMALNLYFIWHLFDNLATVARKYSCPQEGKLLGWRIPYMIFAVLSSVIAHASLLIGEAELAAIAGLILVVPSLILMIFILVTLFSFARSLEEKEDMPVVTVQPMSIPTPPIPVQQQNIVNNENKQE